MKKLKLHFFSMLVLLLGTGQFLNAQCTGDSWDFNEDDFMAGSISATETANGAPVTTNQVDLNGDGMMDVEVTYEAIITTPNANGTCDDGDFTIGAGWGGTGALATSSDFAGTTSDDCPCTNGIIIMTVDFINGFNTDVANFQFDATSQNGSSEAYEYGFGFVSAATDAAGNPITGLNTAAAASGAVAGYCNAQYVGGMTVSSVALTSPTGVFTTQADDLNATANTCTTEGQNGEDTGSGSGANSTLSTGASGLAPTDLITQVTYIYGLSNAPGQDCDSDGDTGVGSNPSGSFAGIEGCYAAPCGYTFDVAVVENCGVFTLDITNVVGEGDADPVGTEAYTVMVNGAAVATGVTGTSQTMISDPSFVADGTTTFDVTIELASDATCISEPVTITAPVGNLPSCGTFPANQAGTDPSLPNNTSN